MGFKSMASYNGEKYGNWFRLQNDGDYANVIFLYRSTADVMMADTHYIKSDSYSGYTTCCGKGCPACSSGVRIQPKLFVPLYVISTTDASGICDRIQFWDRTLRFQPQLLNDVFRGYPDPSGFIFQIIRHGVARDINTTYDIRASGVNNDPNLSYDAICSRFGATFPEYYNLVCRDLDVFDLGALMTGAQQTSYGNQQNNYGNQQNGYGRSNYGAVPRGSNFPGSTIPGTQIPYTTPAANLSMPSVPVNARIPDAAPDPNDMPFDSASAEPGSGIVGVTEPTDDPLRTDEDIDMTNLQF